MESFGDVWNANFPNGRILSIPFTASDEEVKRAITFFDNKLRSEIAGIENPEKIYIEVVFDETQITL